MPTYQDADEGNNVLSIHVDASNRVVPELDKIERYWNKVRAHRVVPSRCEIDPQGLEGVLGNAFILERIAGGLARVRIAGSHMCDLTGVELRHMPVSALFTPASREILSEALSAVFDEPAKVRLRISSQSGIGRAKMEGEMILLPLRSDLGDIDRVLGGIRLVGNIGRTPRRIDVISQSRQSLIGYAGDRHNGPPDLKRPAPDMPAPKKNSPKSTLSSSERPYLKLVVDGND